MTGISIFMEGGGKGVRRVVLRKGMDAFLRSVKAAARQKSMKWQVVPCGPRNDAYRRFCEAAARGRGDFLFLLVDSEEGVTRSPRFHLVARDGWDRTGGRRGGPDSVDGSNDGDLVDRGHVETLRSYYGSRFNGNSLPKRQDLEDGPERERQFGARSRNPEDSEGRVPQDPPRQRPPGPGGP